MVLGAMGMLSAPLRERMQILFFLMRNRRLLPQAEPGSNPGQHERCGATLPTETVQSGYLTPEYVESEAVPIPTLPPLEERERWERDICRPHYAKCIRAGGDGLKGRKWGETQCQACYDACMRHGFWPLRANDKLCPGV